MSPKLNKYLSLKVLGILLCYPDKDWQSGLRDMAGILSAEGLVNSPDLLGFLADAQSAELFDLQEEYVDTFDRIRSLSLHLFEHVHGDGRERGQAMVDLSDRYLEQGLELSAHELPDYLPAFLEYLSKLGHENALEELDEISHILQAIGKKLKERQSPYALIFEALLQMLGKSIGPVAIKAKPEIDFEELDKEWQEKNIEFMGADAPQNSCAPVSCGTCPSSTKSVCNTQGAAQ